MKKNNRALKHKVFGPVEAARNERLSAKLLELAQQPKKSTKAEVEVDGHIRGEHPTIHADANDVMETEADAKAGKGMCALQSLSTPIPASLVVPMACAMSPVVSSLVCSIVLHDQDAGFQECLFYHLLGTAADIIRVDLDSTLQLDFTLDEL